MDIDKIRRLLEEVREGRIDPDVAMERLKILPFEDMGFAKVDTHRPLRRGFPEVIFCQGKTPQQVREIVRRMIPYTDLILGMRASEEIYEAVKDLSENARYLSEARTIMIGTLPPPKTNGIVLVISAGTADLPVAEEAALTAEVMGNRVERLWDVGVAGVHRLLSHMDQLQKATVLVVVAGMEGALPGVVAGLVDKPVIGVPTSVGYGTSFGGVSALLTMLNTCSPGLSVVNIDNGFGAGYLATLINRLAG